jgi:hypothetical protein
MRGGVTAASVGSPLRSRCAWRGQVFKDWKQLCELEDVDLVYIATGWEVFHTFGSKQGSNVSY